MLPFQRFIAPGQVRGMIRYRQSDVERFISAAASRGREDAQASASALSSFDDVPSGAPQPRSVDPEILHDFEEALEAANDDNTASNAALLRDLLTNLSDGD